MDGTIRPILVGCASDGWPAGIRALSPIPLCYPRTTVGLPFDLNGHWLYTRTVTRPCGIIAIVCAVELVLFKFCPDLGNGVVQSVPSALSSFAAFQTNFMTPNTGHSARFLGNLLMWKLAHAIPTHSSDIRLHPLRIAAGILEPLYVLLGISPVLLYRQYSGAVFAATYTACCCVAMYVFNPADLGSLAFLSISLFCVLDDRWALALLAMLMSGLFRESAFHAVWFVLLKDWRRTPLFIAVFLIEYVAIRHFFPGPLRSEPIGLRQIFFGPGLWSLTSLGSVGLASAIVLGYPPNFREPFFRYNCYAFPAWLLLYRFFNGNWSEFRMFLPILLPVILGYSVRSSLETLVCQTGAQTCGGVAAGADRPSP